MKAALPLPSVVLFGTACPGVPFPGIDESCFFPDAIAAPTPGVDAGTGGAAAAGPLPPSLLLLLAVAGLLWRRGRPRGAQSPD